MRLFGLVVAAYGRPGYGSYENKDGSRRLARFPIDHWVYGGPGIAAFQFMGVGAHAPFTQDNGTMLTPKNPRDPKSPKVEKKAQPTSYDAGYQRALVVEAPYDQLDALLRGKSETVAGRVKYYLRGAFNREVYDADTLQSSTERKRFYAPSLELWNYLARFQQKNKKARDEGDPRIREEENRIFDMMRFMSMVIIPWS